jgi:hypothetical protein
MASGIEATMARDPDERSGDPDHSLVVTAPIRA